jgi:hypothetical protein
MIEYIKMRNTMRKFIASMCLLVLAASFALAAPPDYPLRANLVPRSVGGVMPTLGTTIFHWRVAWIDSLYAHVYGSADTSSRADSLLSRGVYKSGNNFARSDVQDTLHANYYATHFYPVTGSTYYNGSRTNPWLAVVGDTVLANFIGIGLTTLPAYPLDVIGQGYLYVANNSAAESSWALRVNHRSNNSPMTDWFTIWIEATVGGSGWGLYSTGTKGAAVFNGAVKQYGGLALFDSIRCTNLQVASTPDSVAIIEGGSLKMAGANLLNVDKVDGLNGDSLMTWGTVNATSASQNLITYYPKTGYTHGNSSPIGAPRATLPITCANTGYYIVYITGVHMNVAAASTPWEAVLGFYVDGDSIINPYCELLHGNPAYHRKIMLGVDGSDFITIVAGDAVSAGSSPKFMVTKVIASGAIVGKNFMTGITYGLSTTPTMDYTIYNTFAPYSHQYGTRNFIAELGEYGLAYGDSCLVNDSLGAAFGQYAVAAYKRSWIINLWGTVEKSTDAIGQFKIAAPYGFWTEKVITDTLKTSMSWKRAFGNAAANLNDTIICAGVLTNTTIVQVTYIYDSGASKFLSAVAKVRPDTIFIIRPSTDEPDSIYVTATKIK